MEFAENTDNMLFALQNDIILLVEKILIHDMKLAMLSTLTAEATDSTDSVEHTDNVDLFE